MEQLLANSQHPGLSWADVGIIALGQNAMGIVAAGPYNSIGIATLSLINAMGLVAIGGVNSALPLSR